MHRLENEFLISEIAKLVPVKRHFAHFKTKHYRFWQPALIIYELLRAILHMLKLGITLSSIIICCRNLRAIYFSSPVLACVCVRSTQWKTNLLLKKHKINFHCVYTKLLNTYTLPFIGNNHVFFFSGFVFYCTFSISIRHSVASWLDLVVFFFICIYMNNIALLLCLALIRSFSRTHQNLWSVLCTEQSKAKWMSAACVRWDRAA